MEENQDITTPLDIPSFDYNKLNELRENQEKNNQLLEQLLNNQEKLNDYLIHKGLVDYTLVVLVALGLIFLLVLVPRATSVPQVFFVPRVTFYPLILVFLFLHQ